MKQRGPLIGLEPTTSTVGVRRATHCATPPNEHSSAANEKNIDTTRQTKSVYNNIMLTGVTF